MSVVSPGVIPLACFFSCGKMGMYMYMIILKKKKTELLLWKKRKEKKRN